ncbi:hypothetical protein BGW38_001384 [Lunasporangiospora selenospora]|uniref:Uncharacterized protein n=1 Tax=Lunasporangiospora selenospora TaxID=979761 RepID=A0A9P6FVN9_9FUNG|nr:hypothetical protein BGW38_001384 [Lunasporangiospora selenospora]
MKFNTCTLLISAALTAVASAVPLVPQPLNVVEPATHILTRRCVDCTQKDTVALNLIVKASADHYSAIAHEHLNNLMVDFSAASVTSGAQDLPQEKAALSVAVQTKIDEAKRACSPEALESEIKVTVTSDSSMDIPWSKKDEIEKKMVELDAKITKLILERIEAQVNAELLSKDCTEKMTNTEIVPTSEAPAPIPEAPAPVPEAPAPVPEAPAPLPEAVPAPAPSGAQPGINVAASIDSKYVCRSGCKDSGDANTVLSLRVNLENEFKPRLEHFYDREVPTACDEKRSSLLGGVLSLVANLNVNA